MVVSATRTLYMCDNLPVLRGLNTDSVDLIATDPPFNAKRVFNAPLGSKAAGQRFDDRWCWDQVTDEWFDLIADEHRGVKEVIEAAAVIEGGAITPAGEIRPGQIKNSMAAFLCWMAPRFIELARILKPTGSLYLHCDDAADSYLRLLLDAVFGRRYFRNAVIWKRSGRSDGRRFGRIHDTILAYGRADATWNDVFRPYSREYIDSFYREYDERGRYKRVDLMGAGTTAGLSGQPWRGTDPTACGRHWSAPRTGAYADWIEKRFIPGYHSIDGVQVRLDALDAHGLIHWPKRGTGQPMLKRYLDGTPGERVNDVFDDIRPVSNLGTEKTGWSTQKPVTLYERIISASSNIGDLVLDPFCGCSTTLVAAERLARQWIGCDIDPQAESVVVTQMGKLLDPEQRELFRVSGEMTTRKSPPRRTDIPRMADGKLRELVWRHQHQGCLNPYCDSRPRAVDLHLDHKIPKIRGGSDAPENRIGLCGNCNMRKGRKAWGAFLNGERIAQPHPESPMAR